MKDDTPGLVELRAGGLRWRLRRAGQGPKVLLLHGTGSSLQSWDACLPGLTPHFSLLIPDLPGHGGTEAFDDRRASLPRMAGALADLLAALGWQPELVAGHSAGAAVMLQLALDGHLPQTRGLLAVNGALQPLPGLMRVVAPAVARLAARSAWLPAWVTRHAAQPRALKNLIASTGSRLDEAGLQHYRALLTQPAHVRGVLDMLASWRLDELQARLPALRTPLWLAAGLADRTVAPAQALELARRLPCARFHPLEGLGHLAHEEAPESINELLLALRDEARDRATNPPCTAKS
ncbi:alpha/beta fold hydrolase BchO [Roseateles toxinivorans]|uniref:Magnesium chelatase accessory protein n=1 Tax=Roseateles toxinivorans TaxID=270368 RepID=A0A4R6QQ03_9BURK|nr:alpha/beta fold hydrolase BchO [Roseateles toxinivorans]TDP71738.1 magnesium chelatase accessory protein [Roseateles toxinivorans]